MRMAIIGVRTAGITIAVVTGMVTAAGLQKRFSVVPRTTGAVVAGSRR